MLNGYTANDEWIRTLAAILKNKKNIDPRGLETYEILNHSTCVDMTQPIVTFEERCNDTDMHKFMPAEAAFILTGRNTVGMISRYFSALPSGLINTNWIKLTFKWSNKVTIWGRYL